MFMFFVMMILNFAISWMNARSAGRIWSESKAVGGMLRAHAIGAYALSILGFTMVYGTLLVMMLPTLLPMFTEMSPDDMWTTTQLASDMLFILTAAFIIPLGYFAWFTSFVSFWRRRSLMGGLNLAWNTFANIRNTMVVARHAPSAMRRISETLFKGKKDGRAMIAMVAIFAIILAIIGGWLTASAIMHRADEKHDFFEGMHCKDDPNWHRSGQQGI